MTAAARAAADQPGRMMGTMAGAAAGIGLGMLLGGGIGTIALGGAVSVPLIAITATAGSIIGERLGGELGWLKEQRASAKEREDIGGYYPCQPLEGKAHAEPILGEQHLPLLEQAIDDARHTLCVRSAFLSDAVVSEALQDKLRRAIEGGTQIFIEYGKHVFRDGQASMESHRRAAARLQALRREAIGFGRGHLFHLASTWTHVREIAVDGRYIIAGSYDWLSQPKAWRKESSFKIHDADLALRVLAETSASIARATSA